MSRAPDQLAPSWLPRQQRRNVDRALRKLFHRNACSFCGEGFEHNHPSAAGFDAQGNVVLAGECCFDRLAKIFGMGLYSDRPYDFMSPRKPEPGIQPPPEQIIDAIVTWQKAIADSDKRLDGVERRGGGMRASEVVLLEHPWKTDDKHWFEQNPSRSHRARMPFPGEVDKMVAATPSGRVLVMLVRQVKPGARLRGACDLSADLSPLPDDETVIHALFDLATQHEAGSRDGAALCALVKRYAAEGAS